MNRILVLVVAILIASCNGKKGDTTSTVAVDSTDVKQALLDQVNAIHDEVMPKMNDIYKLKQKLRDQIANSPKMIAEERKKLERRIASLDSVDNMMRDWMHGFNMPADSVGMEAYREYMEGQMEKIKKVREAMLEIIASESDTTKRVN